MSDKEVAKVESGLPKLPKLADLYGIQDIEKAFKQDQFNLLMNQEPNPKWVQVNKFANNSKYIPIGVIETLLQKIFKSYKIEVLREGVMFNAVFCTVRLHLLHPVTNEWIYFDGVGSQQIQTKADKSPAQLEHINNNAVQMALPASKTYAIKDAAENIGKLFGRDMNRKDVLEFKVDEAVKIKAVSSEEKRKLALIENAKDLTALNDFRPYSLESQDLAEAFRIRQDELTHLDQTVK